MNDIKKIAQDAFSRMKWTDVGTPQFADFNIKIIESACEKARSIGHDAGFKMGRSVNVLPDVIAFKGKP